MAALQVPVFSGLSPRTGERLLPDNGATVSVNCSLTSGEVYPLKYPKIGHLGNGTSTYLSTYRAEWNNVEKWRLWTVDVDCAVAPLSQDVEQRYYWTGDGEPRYATFTNFNTTDWAMGVPNPVTKPTVTPTGGVSSNVTRLYCYTFFSVLGEESGPSPVSDVTTNKIDATWAISNMDASPVSSGTGTASGQIFTDTVNHWLRVGDEVVISTVTHEVTVVAGLTFTVDGAAITGATAWARKAAWNTAGGKRRLYRSAGTNATFQLVADDVATPYNDVLTDAQIPGDELITDGWNPPNPKMIGITPLANGAMVGFVGNQLMFSEPYQPHAWKDDYQYATDFEIIGIASFGTSVVAATAGNPYLADGVEPTAVTMNKVSSVWPCLSKRSVVAFANGVLYATSQGLAYIGMDGIDLWTKTHYTQREWGALDPSSMVAGASNGRVHVRHLINDTESRMLVFYPGEQAALAQVDYSCDELYVDARNGKLYVINPAGVYEWDAEPGQYMEYIWTSKEFVLPKPLNFGAAQVSFFSIVTQEDIDSLNVYIAQVESDNQDLLDNGLLHYELGEADIGEVDISGDNMVNPQNTFSLGTCFFTLYADGVERYTAQVLSNKPFRLPAGYKADRIKISVSGTAVVQSVKLAETMAGLAQL
jgi:hypothetical protein